MGEQSGTQEAQEKEVKDPMREAMPDAMETCPMATMCQGIGKKRGLGILMWIPGALVILGGVLILLEPKVLVWLVGGTAIFVGVAMLAFAYFMRKMAAGFTNPDN